MKKLIAYSSVAHMGFVTMGIFAMNAQGVQGGIFQMLSHGIVSGALFLCVGVIYDRMHTREIAAYGGLVNRMPLYALVFMVFTLANVGLPGTSGFVGEFLTLLGAFRVNTWVAFLATTGVILSAAYALWLYRRVIFGALEKESLRGDPRPVARARSRILAPLVVLAIFFGFYPGADHGRDRRLGRPARRQLPGGAVRRRPARRSCAVRYGAMPTARSSAFLPALPEIMLAVGALVLLMIGAFGGERATALVTALSVALLVVAGARS